MFVFTCLLGSIASTYVTGRFYSSAQAAMFNAVVIGLEHRFYGTSQPFGGDTNVTSLRLLNTEQALADLVYFRMFKAKEYPGSKWVLFGGSYSGTLSAWARLKFPHLFAASIASSAPVW